MQRWSWPSWFVLVISREWLHLLYCDNSFWMKKTFLNEKRTTVLYQILLLHFVHIWICFGNLKLRTRNGLRWRKWNGVLVIFPLNWFVHWNSRSCWRTVINVIVCKSHIYHFLLVDIFFSWIRHTAEQFSCGGS